MSAHDRGHDHSNDELADKIGELWNRQEITMLTDPTALTDSLKRRQKQEQRRLFRLNIQELVPAAALTALFTGLGLVANRGAWAYFAAAVVCAAVGLFLLGSTVRQRRAESRFDHSLRGELERSLSQLRHRAWLYRNILWWYLGPLTIAILLVVGVTRSPGGSSGAAGTIIYLVLLAALYRHLYRSNRRIAAEQYEPEVERHQQLLDQLDRA